MAQRRLPVPSTVRRRPNRNRVLYRTSIKYSTCALPDPKWVCARVAVWANANFIFSCLWLDPIRLTSGPFSTVCTCVGTSNTQNHMQNIRLSFDVSFSRLSNVYVVTHTYVCVCVCGSSVPPMKYSLNSQWFMMVSCKFDGDSGRVCIHAERWHRAPQRMCDESRMTLSIRT